MDAGQHRFEPMHIGQILMRALLLYRQNFLRYVALVSVALAPMYIFGYGFMLAESQSEKPLLAEVKALLAETEIPAEDMEHLLVDMEAQLAAIKLEAEPGDVIAIIQKNAEFSLIMVVFIVLAQIGVAAVMKHVSESYQGRVAGLGQTYRMILPQSGSIVLVSLVAWLVTFVAQSMLIVSWFAPRAEMLVMIAGLVFLLFLSLWIAVSLGVLIEERSRALKSMVRSKQLVSGNMVRVFVLGFAVSLINFAIIWLLVWISNAGAQAMAPSAAGPIKWLLIAAGQVLLTPLGAVACILLYYDLRSRKEIDLERLSRSMGAEPVPTGSDPQPRQQHPETFGPEL